MYAVSVDIRVLTAQRAAFIAATADNHRGTRHEPGNLRFDVLAHTTDPDRFALYELYLHEAAFVAHQQTAHYRLWRETVAPMMAQPRVGERYTVLQPEPLA